MTTSDVVPPDAPPPEPAAKPNGFARLAGVIFNPGQTFESIVRRPDFLVPVLVILVVTIISTCILVPRMDFAATMREQWEKSGMPADKIEANLKFGVAFAKAIAWVSPGLAFLGIVIIAGVLLLAFRLAGGQGTFNQAFSIMLYCEVPSILKGIVVAAIVAGRGSIDPQMIATLVPSNLGFLTSAKEHAMAFAALSSIDLFTLWTLVLITIGFSTMSRLSRAKSAVIVVCLWLLTVLLKLGAAAMQSLRVKQR